MAADSGGESMEEVTDSEEERWKENERVKKCMLLGLFFGHSSLSQCTLQRAPLGGALTENPLSTWLGVQVSKTTCTLLY